MHLYRQRNMPALTWHHLIMPLLDAIERHTWSICSSIVLRCATVLVRRAASGAVCWLLPSSMRWAEAMLIWEGAASTSHGQDTAFEACSFRTLAVSTFDTRSKQAPLSDCGEILPQTNIAGQHFPCIQSSSFQFFLSDVLLQAPLPIALSSLHSVSMQLPIFAVAPTLISDICPANANYGGSLLPEHSFNSLCFGRTFFCGPSADLLLRQKTRFAARCSP